MCYYFKIRPLLKKWQQEGHSQRSDDALTAYVQSRSCIRWVHCVSLSYAQSFKPVNLNPRPQGACSCTTRRDCASLAVIVSGCPVLDHINSVAHWHFSRFFCTGFLLCIIHTSVCSDATAQWRSGLLPLCSNAFRSALWLRSLSVCTMGTSQRSLPCQ